MTLSSRSSIIVANIISLMSSPSTLTFTCNTFLCTPLPNEDTHMGFLAAKARISYSQSTSVLKVEITTLRTWLDYFEMFSRPAALPPTLWSSSVWFRFQGWPPSSVIGRTRLDQPFRNSGRSTGVGSPPRSLGLQPQRSCLLRQDYGRPPPSRVHVARRSQFSEASP